MSPIAPGGRKRTLPDNAVRISVLRLMTAEELRTLTEPLIVYADDTPIAALVPFALYVAQQGAP